jgi:hypothetical protein
MPIKLKIKPDTQKKESEDARIYYNIELNARKSIDGNIMIYSHPDIDIMISPTSTKVVSFPKESLNDTSYNSQKRLFDFLRNKGAIIYDSVQGGNVYGSIEAKYPEESEEADPTQFVLLMIYKFIKKDIPDVSFVRSIKDQQISDLTDPSAADSTELGEVPHEEDKGSIDKNATNSYGTAPGWKVF